MNPEQKRELESQTIVQFLMTSGLDLPKLKQVWDIAAHTSNSFLLKEEFYIALRLVSYLQNDLPCNENSIRTNLVPPLPRFDDYKPSTPGADPVRPGQAMPSAAAAAAGPSGGRMGINVDSLPDLDNLDFSQPMQQPMITNSAAPGGNYMQGNQSNQLGGGGGSGVS